MKPVKEGRPAPCGVLNVGSITARMRGPGPVGTNRTPGAHGRTLAASGASPIPIHR